MRRGLALGVMLSCATSSLEGQTLRNRLTDLFTFGNCGKVLCLDGSVSAANGHGEHFLPDLIAGNSSLIGFLTDAIGATIASTPLAASSGGPATRLVGGLLVTRSTSSGPILAERGQTLGRGNLFLGANLSGSSFRSFRGVPLDGIVLNFTHQDVGTPGLGDPVLENDVLETRLDLNLNILVTSLFATYGLADNVDVSVAIPVVQASFQGRSQAQVFPFGSTAVHFFTGTLEDPGLIASSASYGTASGIGDVAVRVKANIVSQNDLAIAVMGDVRLPTGDEENFLGAGYASFRGLAVVSAHFGEFQPHANLGYHVKAGGVRGDALLATLGFEQPMSSWATMLVDVVSEWEMSHGDLTIPATIEYQFPFKRIIEPSNIPDRRDHQVAGSLGFKFQTAGPTLVTNALIPLYHGGLQPAVFWSTGLEFTF